MNESHFFPWLTCIASLFPRVMAFITFVPIWNGQAISRRLQSGFACVFSALMVPVIEPRLSEFPSHFFFIFIFFIKEVIIGALLGFSVGVFLNIPMAVGELTEHMRNGGASDFRQSAVDDQETSSIGLFLHQGVITLFLMSGGLLHLIHGLYTSFTFWPPFDPFPSFGPKTGEILISLCSHFFAACLLFSAPMIVISLTIHLALALINRFSPGLNVYYESMGLKSLASTLILLAAFTVLTQILQKYFGEIEKIFQLLFKSAPLIKSI